MKKHLVMFVICLFSAHSATALDTGDYAQISEFNAWKDLAAIYIPVDHECSDSAKNEYYMHLENTEMFSLAMLAYSMGRVVSFEYQCFNLKTDAAEILGVRIK